MITADAAPNWRVDVHHHVVPPEYQDSSMPIKIPGTEAQLRSMDTWKIRSAITSLTPRVVLKNLHRLREVARSCNEFQARMMQAHPSRFGSFALLPLPDVDDALKELTYALDTLHLDGVGALFERERSILGRPIIRSSLRRAQPAEGGRLHSSDPLRSAGAYALVRAAFRRGIHVRYDARCRQSCF